MRDEGYMDKPLWGLRVQAPFGALVLSFVCCAPNDGFGPQSGLVQRVVLYAAAWGSKNRTTALTGEEMQSPFGGWRHHLARWEACHWIRGSRGSPMNPVPLPPPQAGAQWMLSHGAMSLQESIERFILSPGWGKVRRSRIRGSREAANQQNAYHAI